MSGSLRAVRDERGEVVSMERLGDAMVELSVRLPHLAATVSPGQFAQLRCADSFTPLLRRPFSIAWTEDDVVSFVLAPVGVGTRMLAALRAGDQLAALGPLGTGFSLDHGPTRCLCVSGGLGCAPFPLLVRELRARGREVTVLSGASTAGMLYPAARFKRGDVGVHVVELTDDGSAGDRGVVTAAVPTRLAADIAVYACGPNRMLAALATVIASGPALQLAEASLEAPMGCGFGTCLGCALPLVADGGGTAWALCCRDGPVMRIPDVAWDRLMALPAAHVA